MFVRFESFVHVIFSLFKEAFRFLRKGSCQAGIADFTHEELLKIDLRFLGVKDKRIFSLFFESGIEAVKGPITCLNGLLSFCLGLFPCRSRD